MNQKGKFQSPRSFVLFESTVLFLWDFFGFNLCFGLAYLIRYGEFNFYDFKNYSFIILFPLMVLVFYIFDLYRSQSRVLIVRPPIRTILANIFLALLASLIVYSSGNKSHLMEFAGRGVLAIALGLYTLWAAIFRYYIGVWSDRNRSKYRWLFVGKSEHYQKLIQYFKEHPDMGEVTPLEVDDLEEEKVLHEIEQSCQNYLSGIIIDEHIKSRQSILSLLMKKRLTGVRIYDLLDFYEQFLALIPIFVIRDGWFAVSRGFVLIHNAFGLRLKRIFDIVVSSLLITITFPLMILSALIIRLQDLGPAVFKQSRVGENNNEFTLYKFRSMTVDAEKDGAKWAEKRDSRITPFGHLIRLTRIDELPQLFNVLKGEMSFIGPRPERKVFTDMLEKDIPYFNLRHLVKPGITGWAQVNYPYGASREDAIEKLQYDLYYIKNYSFFLDLIIMIKTIRVIFLGRGR